MARELRKTIRFSEEEWQQTERRAKAADMEPYTFVRAISTGELGVDSMKTQHKLWHCAIQLRDMKDQLLKAGYVHDSQALGAILDMAREALAAVGAYKNLDLREGDDYKG